MHFIKENGLMMRCPRCKRGNVVDDDGEIHCFMCPWTENPEPFPDFIREEISYSWEGGKLRNAKIRKASADGKSIDELLEMFSDEIKDTITKRSKRTITSRCREVIKEALRVS